MSTPRHPASALALSAVCMVGCLVPAEDEAVGDAEQAVITANALTANALTANALTANALTANALTANALTANALTANALTANALAGDANARVVLKYIIGCALPADAQVDVVLSGTTYHYTGQLGLAPNWGQDGGSCDDDCRTWVSGCVLSRLNYLGQTVPISVRGHKSELAATTTERLQYPYREATYYGDIFASPQIRLGCLAPGATSDPRVCGPSLAGCAISFTGSCCDACDPPDSDGGFRNCHDHLHDLTYKYPPGATAYLGSVTVFLE